MDISKVDKNFDSPYIAVHLEEPFVPPSSHMTALTKYGVPSLRAA